MTKSELASFIKSVIQDTIQEHKKVFEFISPMNDSKYCTIGGVTEKFKVTKATVHNWAKRGTVKKYKINGRTLYKLAEIEALSI